MSTPTGDELKMLLVEYQKAQDSAEHHDDLVTAIAGLWLGSAVLIGFVLTGLGSARFADHKTVLYAIIALERTVILGWREFLGPPLPRSQVVHMYNLIIGWAWICALSGYWAFRSGYIKNKKYKRCQAIEERLGGIMEQHTERASTGRWWRWLFFYLPIVALAVVWVVLLIDVVGTSARG